MHYFFFGGVQTYIDDPCIQPGNFMRQHFIPGNGMICTQMKPLDFALTVGLGLKKGQLFTT